MEDTASTVKVVGKEPLVMGRWLNMYNLSYQLPGQPDVIKTQNLFERPVKPGQERLSSGSDIIAIGIKDGRLKIILEIIYRIPVEKYLIQVPAGMRDEHETDLVKCAARELHEETGYVGKAPESPAILALKPILESPILYNDPWKSNETTNLVTLEVDFSDPANITPTPNLEEDEDIEVIVCDLLNLREDLALVLNGRRYELDNRVQ